MGVTIELQPFEGGPACCSRVLVNGGHDFADRGAWCRATGRLVIDGTVVAVEVREWADVQAWAERQP